MNEKPNEKQKLKNIETPKKMKNAMGKKEKQRKQNKEASPGLGIEPGSPYLTVQMTCALDNSAPTTHILLWC